MLKRTILFATNNHDKYLDMALVFGRVGIELKQVPLVNVKEGKKDILENARTKALSTAKNFPNRVVVASDGGVLIPYLGKNWNYVLTKRLGGLDMKETLSERNRAEKLLELLKNAKGKQRRVIWRGSVVVVKDDQVLWEFIATGGDGYILDYIPNDFMETGFWLGYIWYEPEAKTTYMNIPYKDRYQYSLFKQKMLQKLKEVNLDGWFS